MKMKILAIFIAIGMLLSVGIAIAKRGGEGGRGDGPVIYVENQGLFYDSIVTAEPLPYNIHNAHTFQELYIGPMGLTTMYGPGDTQYNGGRWWFDVNGNDIMDPEGTDHYFGCPLLGPGY
ncbi:MAG: hypothetical protein JSW06_03970 [Thermoplasmatales archaeon]|nr:MAG: hypothetical protein JSW06_03970 [Thermoplasmatales archaeon]